MKRILLLTLALAMLLSLAACGCQHTDCEKILTEVDTDTLTAKWEVICSQCGKVTEKEETATGLAPVNSALPLSPADWFACLTTHIKTYDTSGMLVPMEVSSEDGAALHSIVSPTGFKSVISFFDKDDAVITTQDSALGGKVHRIRIEAQFDNSTATTFYTLLMLMAMTNNADWDNQRVNDLASQVMAGQTVTDNGYSYSMQILSVQTHTVAVNIVAQ